jgi:5-(carboxyamino)imidazole ribonucleotide mutase
MPLVAILMGSQSDAEYMQKAIEVLNNLSVEHKLMVLSAHRQPEAVREFSKGAREQGVEVIIAGAGGAAHLPGVVASWTTIPVIGVPLPTSELKGVDALHSIVQMPAGVPVATVGIGTAGARNAAFLAAQILGLKHEKIRQAYESHRLIQSRPPGLPNSG